MIERPQTIRSARPPLLTALTGLRFFAAFAVVVYHYVLFGLLHLPFGLDRVALQGYTGVNLFFVLSGFIIAYNYGPGFTDGTAKLWTFLVARFARIYPMHAVGLLLITPPLLLLGPAQPWGLATWLTQALMLQSAIPLDGLIHAWNQPSWSISTEFAFYLMFPLFAAPLFRRVTTANRAVAAAMLFFGAQVATAFASEAVVPLFPAGAFPITPGYYWPLARGWEFAIGCALAVIYTESRDPKPAAWVAFLRDSATLRTGGLLAVAACLLTIPTVVTALTGDASGYSYLFWVRYLAYTPLYAALVLLLAVGSSPVTWLLEWWPVVLLGEASYSLYATHFVWLTITLLLAGRGIGFTDRTHVVEVVLSVALSVAFYRFIETPTRVRLRAALDPVRALVASV